MAAEAFAGFTVERYRAYVRDFMQEPAVGFDGMTYGEGFYLPMTALVAYLAEHGFTVFISSGSERALVRELIADTERDYGDLDTAAGFAETCRALGFFTVSMKDEFLQIYKDSAVKTLYADAA